MRHHSALLALSLVLSAPAAAQQVWIVDDDLTPGVQFLDLQSAVDAAGEFDIVTVRAGSYAGFSVQGKSLAVVAAHGARPTIDSAGVTVSALGAGQHFSIAGIDVHPGDAAALSLSSCQGPVVVEDCTLRGAKGAASVGVDVRDCSAVVLSRCAVSGGLGGILADPDGAHGLVAADSMLHLFDCTVDGEIAGLWSTNGGVTGNGGQGGHGLILRGGFLFAGKTAIGGARGGHGLGNFVAGCGHAGNGGDGLVLEASPSGGAAPHVELLASTVAAGNAGSVGTGCVAGVSGTSTTVLAGSTATSSASARSAVMTRPFLSGATGYVTIQSTPGDLVALLLSVAPAPIWLPVGESTLVPALPGVILPLGAVPASGLLSQSMALTLPPGFDGAVFHAQPLVLSVTDGAVFATPLLGVVLPPEA